MIYTRMRHMRIFESEDKASFWEVPSPVDPSGDKGMHQEVSERVDRRVSKMFERLGLRRQRWFHDQECRMDMDLELTIPVAKDYRFTRAHHLYAAAALLEDDYWQLSVMVLKEISKDDEYEHVVELHLMCDDITGLAKAIEGPVAELKRRMDDLEEKFGDLEESVWKVGDGLKKKG